MSEQEIASLTEFGLTALQARVHVALLRLGTSRASQICPEVRIVRPEAYRILHELSVKGLVQRNLGPPATYTPIAPAKALTILTRRLRDTLVSLSKKRVELTNSLSSYTPDAGAPIERFAIIAGGENAMLRANQIVREAKTDYSAIISKYGLSRVLDSGAASATISAKRRKRRVRVISEVDASNIKFANYLSRHVELRTSRDLLFYMDIVDCSEMMFGPAFPARGEELGERQFDLWTNSPKFVRGMYAIFERLWAVSPRFDPSKTIGQT